MKDYWNHNSAYHDRILAVAAERPRHHALDVGCGEGLLLQRLAPFAGTVTGIDPDPSVIKRSRSRLAGLPDATVHQEDFASYRPEGQRFDLITFVASLHHLDLADSLVKARDLLNPGGDLLVVGLAANKTSADWFHSALVLPWVRLSSFLHRETRDIGVPTAQPRESLTEIRAVAGTILPGVRIRRGLYYRYLLRWTRPEVRDVGGGR